MKEIKFREKYKASGKWCYGIPFHTKFGCDYMTKYLKKLNFKILLYYGKEKDYKYIIIG